MQLAVIFELRRQDPASVDALTILVDRFVDDREAVSTAQVGMKVDLGAKQLGQLQCHRFGQACGIGCTKQGVSDDPAAHFDHRFGCWCSGLADKVALCIGCEREIFIALRDRQFEPADLAVWRDLCADRAACAQLSQGLLSILVIEQEFGRQRVVGTQSAHQGVDRVTTADIFLAHERYRDLILSEDRLRKQHRFVDQLLRERTSGCKWCSGGQHDRHHGGAANGDEQGFARKTSGERAEQIG